MIQQDAATAIAAAGITIGGVATGLSYETLLAGFAGGLVSLSFLRPMGIWQRIWTPITATLAAGYTAPVAVGYIANVVGDQVAPLSVKVFAAFAVGVLAQVAIPATMGWARRRLDKSGGRTQ